MTLAASTGVASLAAHQVLVSIFFVGCKFGDAISQTAQAYLPACFPQLADASSDASSDTSNKGSDSGSSASAADDETVDGPPPVLRQPPPASARRLSQRLLRLSVVLGCFVSTAAFLVATKLPTLFTSSSAVLANVFACGPLLFLALILHPPTMTAEGLLIGSLEVKFLAKAYAVNCVIFLSALYMVGSRRLGLLAVWCSLAAFQLIRLGTFTARLRLTRLAFRPVEAPETALNAAAEASAEAAASRGQVVMQAAEPSYAQMDSYDAVMMEEVLWPAPALYDDEDDDESPRDGSE